MLTVGSVRTLTAAACLTAASVVVARDAAPQELRARTASIPAPAVVTTPLAMRSLALPDSERVYNLKQSRLGEHHRPGPFPETPVAPPAPQLAPRADPTPVAPATDVGGGAVVLERNRALADVETDNGTSGVGEPSVAARGQQALVTGNWYASFSGDGGENFVYVNPDTTFPPIQGQPFCCDQVALYDPEHDLMVWYLQYVRDNDSNTGRLAVAQGEDIANQAWRVYDFKTDELNLPDQWFDFPKLAASGNFLYLTTNVFTTTPPESFTRALALRLPLDALAAYESFDFSIFETTENFSLQPTRGATDTMYFADHMTLNTLRVFTWPEDSDTITTDDVTVDAWSNAQRVAPGPDGRDWLGRADQRLTAGWLSGDTIGFAWTAAQDANRPFPHVRVAILNKDTKQVVAQPHLWNADFAFAYPAAAPNAAGRVGVSVFYGGGAQHFPSHAVGVLDADNDGWRLVTTATGTHGPAGNQSGDYLDVQPLGQDTDVWVATGFTLQNGPLRTDIEPRFIQFRLADGEEPPVDTDELVFEYVAPVVCGVQRRADDLRLAPGAYATAIDVRNPTGASVGLSERLVLTMSSDDGGQPGGGVEEMAADELGAGEAREIECGALRRRLSGGDGSFPEPGYIKGLLLIQSEASLDVSAMYSSASVDSNGDVTGNSDVDVERIPERALERQQ